MSNRVVCREASHAGSWYTATGSQLNAQLEGWLSQAQTTKRPARAIIAPTFIYALLTRGRPSPLHIVIFAMIFCTINGFFQGYYMVYCAEYDDAWLTDIRLILGGIMFLLGMAINIHSDDILRNLRKPGEINYKIPRGGMFEYVSGANFLGEIIEWFGYALATWSLPALSFAFFTLCSIGPRAYHHHRYYLEKFEDYPKSRKALIPFVF